MVFEDVPGIYELYKVSGVLRMNLIAFAFMCMHVVSACYRFEGTYRYSSNEG